MQTQMHDVAENKVKQSNNKGVRLQGCQTIGRMILLPQSTYHIGFSPH